MLWKDVLKRLWKTIRSPQTLFRNKQVIKLAQIADFGCAVWLDSQILGLCFLCLALLLLRLLHVAELLLMVGSDVVSQWLGRPSAHLDAYGHPIRRMVLAKEATRIFPIFVVNKELPNFGRNSLRHYSFLRNGRHPIQLVQQTKSDW